MTFVERIVLAFQPIAHYLLPFFGFNAIVSLVLAVLIAIVILQNRRKNQSITVEVDNLIRRYVVFRGHRQALIKFHKEDEKTKHEILRAISVSWNHFKGMLENHALILYKTDRRARSFLAILGIIMASNSFRILASGELARHGQWGGVVFFLRELPLYLFLITGFILISIQSYRWKKRPLTSFNGELEAIFSDTEKTQEALNNEFDPLEESFDKEGSWPEES
jgi:low affinity Fe/Cu permease